jgi:transcriptional regulator with XRE-family HTH domain
LNRRVPDEIYDKYCRVAPRRNETATQQTIEIGQRFRLGRQQAGLTQRRVAERADVSQSEVSRLERGRRPGMALFRLVAIAYALGPQFPFGTCPHDHRCVYSRRPPEEDELLIGQARQSRAGSEDANGFDDWAADAANDDRADEVELEPWVPQLDW